MFHLIIILIICIIICYVYYKIYLEKYYRNIESLPGPKMYPIIGNNQFLFCNDETGHIAIRKLANEYKNGFRYYSLGYLTYMIYTASDAEKLLTSTKNIDKSYTYNFLHSFLGTGLLCSNGKKWQNRRKMLTTAFHFDILQQFLEIFREESNALVNTIRSKEIHKNGINLQTIISQFTLSMICETAMGFKINALGELSTEYRENIHKIGSIIVDRFLKPWLIPEPLFKLFGDTKKLQNFIKPIHNFTKTIIIKRKENVSIDSKLLRPTIGGGDTVFNKYNKKLRSAMLDTLLNAEIHNEINQMGIEEEVNTFIFEGYDTTQTAISFIIFMLAHHKTEQLKCYEEIQKIYDNNDNKPLNIYDYNNMEYLTCFIKETLRLYPPVPFIGRQLTEEITFANGTLPKGTTVQLLIFDLHRDERYFPEPMKFDPNRFSSKNTDNHHQHPFAYIPFSGGSRNCIGQKFAMLELKTVISTILMNFEIEPITKINDIIFKLDLILRIKNSINVKFMPRIKI